MNFLFLYMDFDRLNKYHTTKLFFAIAHTSCSKLKNSKSLWLNQTRHLLPAAFRLSLWVHMAGYNRIFTLRPRAIQSSSKYNWWNFLNWAGHCPHLTIWFCLNDRKIKIQTECIACFRLNINYTTKKSICVFKVEFYGPSVNNKSVW